MLAIVADRGPAFGMDIKATVSVPEFHAHFDTEKGCLTDAKLEAVVHQGIEALIG